MSQENQDSKKRPPSIPWTTVILFIALFGLVGWMYLGYNEINRLEAENQQLREGRHELAIEAIQAARDKYASPEQQMKLAEEAIIAVQSDCVTTLREVEAGRASDCTDVFTERFWDDHPELKGVPSQMPISGEEAEFLYEQTFCPLTGEDWGQATRDASHQQGQEASK